MRYPEQSNLHTERVRSQGRAEGNRSQCSVGTAPGGDDEKLLELDAGDGRMTI